MATLKDTGYKLTNDDFVSFTSLVGRVITITDVKTTKTAFGESLRFTIDVNGKTFTAFLSPDDERLRLLDYFDKTSEPIVNVRVKQRGKYIFFEDASIYQPPLFDESIGDKHDG